MSDKPIPPAGSVRPKPLRINFHGNDNDFQCLLLGALGFSTRCITEQTGLTGGQVGYRLKKGKIKRADYRNGRSDFASMVLSRTQSIAEKQLLKQLE